MSWIFGFVSFDGAPVPEGLRHIHAEPAHGFESNSSYIACGPDSRTCAHSGDAAEGWIFCGLGLEPEAGGVRILTPDGEPPQAGHFVLTRWNSDEVVIRTDPLGLRSAYLCESEGGLLFSTRLDWIARAANRSRLDLGALATRFLSFTQLSYESGVKGITRLGPGSRAAFSTDGLTMSEGFWSPAEEDDDAASRLAAAVEQFLHPHSRERPSQVSLGLSGGIDSRLMLALAAGQPDLSAHVFGFNSEPDVVVARELAQDQNIDLRWFDTQLPAPDECVRLLRKYVATTSGFGFASDLIEKRLYASICGEHGYLVFGLGGELIRRQFLNRFLLTGGSRALLRSEPTALHGLLLSGKPDLVTPDAFREFQIGAQLRLDAAVAAMPDAGSFGTHNWADLFMTRYRVANPHMAHQTLLDEVGRGYSPFEQVTVLDQLFAIPVRDRRNSRLSKRIITERSPSLTRHPLVMNDMEYSFEMSTGLAVAWTRFRTRNRLSYLNRARVELLRHLEEFVRDLAVSNGLENDPVNDGAAVRKRVAEFYDSGDLQAAESVENWLTFTLWRTGFS